MIDCSSERIQAEIERRKQAEQDREEMQRRMDELEKSAKFACQGWSKNRRI